MRVELRGEDGFKLSLVEGLKVTIPLSAVGWVMVEFYRDVDFQTGEERGVMMTWWLPGEKKPVRDVVNGPAKKERLGWCLRSDSRPAATPG